MGLSDKPFSPGNTRLAWLSAIFSFLLVQCMILKETTRWSTLPSHGEDVIHRNVHRREDSLQKMIDAKTVSRNFSSFCVSWDTDGDDFWTHNPDWEVTDENETHYCFAPIQDTKKADFVRNLHTLQWNEAKCTQVETSVQTNSGYGASVRWLVLAFMHAYRNGRPFQIEWSKRRWLYATNDISHWAYCESEDITCYYLPISPCNRVVAEPKHEATRWDKDNEEELMEALWLQAYMLRPRQVYRRKLFEMRQKLKVQYPCTTMHIRRGDAGLPRPPYRRYAAVQEYIDMAELKEGENIVLLTDDQTTIDEIQEYHPNYNWIYLDKPRNTGTSGGFDGHIPSGDEGLEMLAIETELRVATSCQKVVCGMSGFMGSVIENMNAQKKNYTLYFVDTRVSKEEAMKFAWKGDKRGQSLLKAIEEQKRPEQKEPTNTRI